MRFLGGGPIRSREEIADQQVKEWQEGSAKALHGWFARMRRHPDFKRAADAGEDGHHERNQATTKRLALWAEWESTMLADIQSTRLANEARAWILRQHERGKTDATDPPPKLVLYEGVLNECFKGAFCDANDDAIFRECLHRIIADDAKAMMPLIPAKTPALTAEELSILEVLANESPTPVTEADLVISTGNVANTVRKYLKRLRDRNLIDRPCGRNKGNGITAAGLLLIRQK